MVVHWTQSHAKLCGTPFGAGRLILYGWSVRRLLRVVIISGIALATLLVVIAGTVVFVVRHSFPTYDGTIELTGLDGDVEVIRDTNGIPQIYADSPSDLFAAQGYVHAQDRFFEMDFRRHVTAGRLSELFGADALETDKFVRTLGWRKVAEKELGLLSPSTRQYLDDYARGVNAYLDTHSGSGLSLEYAVLSLQGHDYRPEPWTAADSLAWLKAMAWDLGGNMDEEITRTKLVAAFPARNIESLYPPYPYDRNEPIMSTGVDRQRRQVHHRADRPRGPPRDADQGLLKSLDTVDKVAKGLPQLLGRGDGIGSNSWVVSGDHTTTGKPLLANDPHLGATMPGIWTQVGLHCNNVSQGVSVRRLGLQLLGTARGRDRPQQRDLLGVHQPRPRRHRPLPRAHRRQQCALQQQVAHDGDPRGDLQGRRPGRSGEDHRPRDPARSAHLRRRQGPARDR